MMKDHEIYKIIQNGDDDRLKDVVKNLLHDYIKGKQPKDEVCIFPNCLESIPLELGRNEPYKPKDDILAQVLLAMPNFDQCDEDEAREKAAIMLEQLEIR